MILIIILGILQCIYYIKSLDEEFIQYKNINNNNIDNILNSDKFNNAIDNIIHNEQEKIDNFNDLVLEIKTQNDIYDNISNLVDTSSTHIIDLLNELNTNEKEELQSIKTIQASTLNIFNKINSLQIDCNKLIDNINAININDLNYIDGNNLNLLYKNKEILNTLKNIYEDNMELYESNSYFNNFIDYINYGFYNSDGQLKIKSNWFFRDNNTIDFVNLIDLIFNEQCNNMLFKLPKWINDYNFVYDQYILPYSKFTLNVYGEKFILDLLGYSMEYNGINKNLHIFDESKNVFICDNYIYDNGILIAKEIDGNIYKIDSSSINQIYESFNENSLFYYEMNDSDWFDGGFFVFFDLLDDINLSYVNNLLLKTFKLSNMNSNLLNISNVDIDDILSNTSARYMFAVINKNDLFILMFINLNDSKCLIEQYVNGVNPLFRKIINL